jgi:hypothetical protein
MEAMALEASLTAVETLFHGHVTIWVDSDTTLSIYSSVGSQSGGDRLVLSMWNPVNRRSE